MERIPWHSEDWDAVLAGTATASHYFARPGLIRKDRLAAFAPEGHHPRTRSLQTFKELCRAAADLLPQTSDDGSTRGDEKVLFVLKKAHGSNAHGIRFLCRREALLLRDSELTASHRSCRRTASAVGAVTTAVVTIGAACIRAVSSRRSGGSGWSSSSGMTEVLLSTGLLFVTAVVAAVSCNSIINLAEDPRVADLRQMFPPVATKAPVWVLQRYIQPQLYGGRKFHLRALLLCIGSLRAFVYEDVRMLVATDPFDLGSHDSSRISAHVTNMGVNRECDGYDEQGQNLGMQSLGLEQYSTVLNEVVEVLATTLRKVKAAGRRNFFTLSNCWELFGVDFLVEEPGGKVILLEINPSPSLAMYEGGGQHLVANLFPDPFQKQTFEGWREVPLERK